MSEQMSDETARDIIRFGNPVIASMMTGALSGIILEYTTSWSGEYKTQLEARREAAILKTELGTLNSAKKLVGENQAITEQVEARESQITVLEAQKDALGSEAINAVEAYGVPFVMAATVAIVGIRRAIKKSTVFQK